MRDLLGASDPAHPGSTRSVEATDDPVAAAGSDGGALAVGALVGRFRVRRLLGEGGMGRVYLARDTILGRSVALKVIRRERVGDADVEHFIQEARTTASLSHPHIVVLYDVGDHRGSPFLALEYLDGESLRDRAARERLSVDETLRLARAVAAALAHAHAAGIRHCDLKPSNVMLPNDGRVRVVDFGLALSDRGQQPSSIAGTPDWMAPEQWRAESLTDRVDVWALAVIVHELLSGEHPFGAARSTQARTAAVVGSKPPSVLGADVPPAVADLVSRSLAREASERPSAAEWVRVLDDVLARAAPPDEASPYRGLSPFTEEHAHVFFGREAEIESFLERLRVTPTLPIVGPSGAGKSSFLYAGIIPRLRLRERWRVLSLRPGADPFTALAHRLVSASASSKDSTGAARADSGEVAALASELRSSPALLALRLATIAAADRCSVLLAVDQLEEIFTHGVPDADVARFLEGLTTAADDAAEPVRVIATLRDDFLGRIADLRQLFVLRKLGPLELRRAISGPLDRHGYRFDEPSIVDDILSEVGGVAGDLPLLQFACRALWDARDPERRLLLRASYRRLGGVAGALARHAEGFLSELTVVEQRTARHLLTRLCAGTSARRVVPREALLADLDSDAAIVLDRLLAARLVVQRRAPGEKTFLVELAHESLMKSWEQLARWLDESREERRLLDELEDAASFWERRGARAEETWKEKELVAARTRIEQLGVSLPANVEAFLAAGERRHAERQGRARRRLALGAAAAVVLTTGSLFLAGEFRRQKIAAEEQARALRLAGGNLGRVEIELRPFDWSNGARVPVSPAALPALTWRLHGPKPGDVHHPGPVVPADLVRAAPLAGTDPETRVELVEAPGGMAFLRIDGRGRAGERCAPSWIRLQSLPGYAERSAEPRRLTIDVPTCQASAAETMEIPAGPFVYGGRGVPATQHDSYVQPEQIVELPTYRIDRTEVSNAAFAPFAALEPISGYPAPKYPTDGVLARSGAPEMPVTSIDAFAAEAFCRYMGKRLPGDFEFTKAARGGSTIDGRPNPEPRRLYPWGTTFDERCVNLAGEEDGSRTPADVNAYACGASPYGVLNLAGNALEWISREGQTDRDTPLRVVRGGGAASPRALEHTTTIFRNGREARYFDFEIGVRCVSGGHAPGTEAWDEP